MQTMQDANIHKNKDSKIQKVRATKLCATLMSQNLREIGYRMWVSKWTIKFEKNSKPPSQIVSLYTTCTEFHWSCFDKDLKYDHITPVLKNLHWLPVCDRIKYILCFQLGKD